MMFVVALMSALAACGPGPDREGRPPLVVEIESREEFEAVRAEAQDTLERAKRVAQTEFDEDSSSPGQLTEIPCALKGSNVYELDGGVGVSVFSEDTQQEVAATLAAALTDEGFNVEVSDDRAVGFVVTTESGVRLGAVFDPPSVYDGGQGQAYDLNFGINSTCMDLPRDVADEL
ncbi:hypothetical protein [Aeromicrobium halocynthiae]